MTTKTLAAGRFFWHELMANDTEGAKAFYARVAGWEAQPFDAAPMPYWILNANGQAVAGLMDLPEQARSQGAPPHWLGYVYVTDVEQTAEKARASGGKVIVPIEEVSSVGRFTMLADPQGAVIGALEPDEAPPAQPETTPPGHFRWAELATSDPEGAFAFYSGLFGWQATDSMDMGEAGVYRMFGASDAVTLGGMYVKPAEMPVSAWLYYVNVADLEEAVGTVESLGGRLLNGPMSVPGGERVAQCLDDQGAAFALHSYR